MSRSRIPQRASARAASSSRLVAVTLAVVTAAFVLALAASGIAQAAGGTPMCFQEKEGGAIKEPKESSCPSGYRLTQVGGANFDAEEEATLKGILPHIKYLASGVGGKPTIQFSSVNVQVVNGEGTTASLNGEGNLVIGYDENPANRSQTGSHNLILGSYQQYTSFGGILAGAFNATEAEYASVLGGHGNDADGARAVVDGGEANVAYGLAASVSGGSFSSAGGKWSTVSGGEEDRATGEASAIQGGFHNYAVGEYTAVDGGEDNWAEANRSTLDGGYKNTTLGELSAIFGGKGLKTSGLYEARL